MAYRTQKYLDIEQHKTTYNSTKLTRIRFETHKNKHILMQDKASKTNLKE